MTEIYNTDRNYEREAVQSLDEFHQAGHEIGLEAQCSKTCPACTKNPTTPEQEYKRITALLLARLDGPPRRKEYKGAFAISRQSLHALAQHSAVTFCTGKGLPVIVEVYVVYKTNDKRKAVATVRSHAPYQGSRKAHTKGYEMEWTERSSEGIDPHPRPTIKP